MDIVERLVCHASWQSNVREIAGEMLEAADEIARLRAEVIDTRGWAYEQGKRRGERDGSRAGLERAAEKLIDHAKWLRQRGADAGADKCPWDMFGETAAVCEGFAEAIRAELSQPARAAEEE